MNNKPCSSILSHFKSTLNTIINEKDQKDFYINHKKTDIQKIQLNKKTKEINLSFNEEINKTQLKNNLQKNTQYRNWKEAMRSLKRNTNVQFNNTQIEKSSEIKNPINNLIKLRVNRRNHSHCKFKEKKQKSQNFQSLLLYYQQSSTNIQQSVIKSKSLINITNNTYNKPEYEEDKVSDLKLIPQQINHHLHTHINNLNIFEDILSDYRKIYQQIQTNKHNKDIKQYRLLQKNKRNMIQYLVKYCHNKMLTIYRLFFNLLKQIQNKETLKYLFQRHLIRVNYNTKLQNVLKRIYKYNKSKQLLRINDDIEYYASVTIKNIELYSKELKEKMMRYQSNLNRFKQIYKTTNEYKEIIKQIEESLQYLF